MTFHRSVFLFALAGLAACSPSPPPAPLSDVQKAEQAADAARRSGTPPPVPPVGLLGQPDAQGFAELDWTHMVPPEDLRLLKDAPPVVHVGNKQGKQFGTLHTVEALSGKKVRLMGYVVPLDTNAQGQMTEFFFVPFYGACIHVPPPPPNMLVDVKLAAPIDTPQIWDPFWLRGTLVSQPQHNAVAASAYSMTDAQLLPYSNAAAPDTHFE
ncbi:MAG TPA: DUF3299 domain-containing protein [Pinirhizobacter sp.]|uniref:DUF3299 domain-containing protein n=1 Tax=Pinirhizobacter sp. TaxID=2950432 RepID=UPI002CA9D0AE|nr:DUF3299 domain-containing protein [Pinirhizobacter sp.]HMH69652.1 DUF3299 domain-containing protein [Pinirhizobacter sp.]